MFVFRRAIVFLVMMASVAACGSSGPTRVAVGSTSPVVSSEEAVAVGIVEGSPPGTFVVVDGATASGKTTKSRIMQLSQDGSVVLRTLDHGLLAPVGWRDATTGVTSVVGVQCASVEHDGGVPTCPEAPLVVVQVDKGEVHVKDLGVTTSSAVGFSAAPDGTAIVIVALQAPPDDRLGVFHGFRVDADGHITDLGVTGSASVCADPDGALVVPRNLRRDDAPRPVRRVVDGKLVDVSTFPEEDQPSDVPQGVACGRDGALLTAIGKGGAVEQHDLDIATGVTSVVPTPPAGTLMQTSGGHRFVWRALEGGDQWGLEIYDHGSWNAVAKVQSIEAPRLTTFSGSNAAFVVVTPGRVSKVHLAADVVQV